MGGAIQLRGRYLSQNEEEWRFFAPSSFPRFAGTGAPVVGKDGMVARGLLGAEEGLQASDFLEGGRRGVDGEDRVGMPYLLCSAESAAE
jgi:hypothetical protein